MLSDLDIRDRYDADDAEIRRQDRIARSRAAERAALSLSDEEIEEVLSYLSSTPGGYASAINSLKALRSSRRV